MAAFGFTPRFASGRSIRADTSGSSDQAIRIQGLTLDGGRILVDHVLNGGSLIAQVLGNVIENFAGPVGCDRDQLQHEWTARIPRRGQRDRVHERRGRRDRRDSRTSTS